MFCNICGGSLRHNSECASCGKTNAQYRLARHEEELDLARKRLERQTWPAYGWMVGFSLIIGSFFLFGYGFAWEGWAPKFITEWVGLISIWSFVVGIGYGIGIFIDDNKLSKVEPGDAFRSSSWRFILAAVAAISLLYYSNVVYPDFFFS